MQAQSLKEKIKSVRNSIVAIGYSPAQNQFTFSGSGFGASNDGKILTAAHIFNQTPVEFQSKILGMVMTKQEENGLEHYTWLSLSLIKKDDQNDIAVFQVENYEKTLLKKLDLSDSDKIEVGQDAYFIGFPYPAELITDNLGITLIVNRTIVSNVKQDGVNPSHPRNLIIVDAISNPGNSGCPLIDTESNKVIGIMTMAFSTRSKLPQFKDLDVRGPMHIAGARPINIAKNLL